MSQSKAGRRRRSSSIIYQEPAESIEHTSDQAALPNLNANWVNAKGELNLRGPLMHAIGPLLYSLANMKDHNIDEFPSLQVPGPSISF
jgi:hypothetical protein